MNGTLFLYEPQRNLVAFQSGSLTSSRSLIFLGGLTDGFLSVPYLENLSKKLAAMEEGCSLIQVLFRSSNLQYGWHTLDDDVDDLQQLLDYLTEHRPNLQSIVLMGHSTGCQDILHYLRRGKPHPKISRVILQGAVSDRQYLSRLDSTRDQLNYCRNHGEDQRQWLPRDLHEPPLTIERCRSLNERNSIEDLFSSDLTDEELKKIYSMIDMPIDWIWSKQDQYVPDDLRDEVLHFVQTKLAKKSNSTFLLLENADHFVQDLQEQNVMIEHILQLLITSSEFKED